MSAPSSSHINSAAAAPTSAATAAAPPSSNTATSTSPNKSTSATATTTTKTPHHAWEGATAAGSVEEGGTQSSSKQLWERVQEDEHGNLILEGSTSAQQLTLSQRIQYRRHRMERNDYAQRHRRLWRDMIRYVYVVIDASRWMRHKELVLCTGGTSHSATLLHVTVHLLSHHFIPEFYDQNPLSQLGLIWVLNGEAEILTPLSHSSSISTHQLALQSILQAMANTGNGGEFSLQNGLHVAGRSLGHQPSHASREIVIVTAALSTCDPGRLLQDTLPKLLHSKIRVSCLALTAELHICHTIATSTHGIMGVCLDKSHFREWLQGQCVPPPRTSTNRRGSHNTMGESIEDTNENELENQHEGPICEMIHMGFPTRITSDIPSLVHSSSHHNEGTTSRHTSTMILATTSYACPQCQAKQYELPTDCAVCQLPLVLAPHLARSFHHLFPVSPFVEMTTSSPVSQPSNKNNDSALVVSSSDPTKLVESLDAGRKLVLQTRDDADATVCYSCLKPLMTEETTPTNLIASADATTPKSVQTILRFQCPDCRNCFCVDCDAYLHETLHNCPGCLRLM